MNISLIAIDLAKSTFQVCGVNRQGKEVFNRAISEAARRPKMRVVAPRSLEQTDMILLHRIRERRVRARTALLNQIRGLLSEYGIVLPAGAATLRKALPVLLEDAENGLTIAARRYLQDLFDEWRDLDERIHESERSIRTLASESPAACRLMDIRGGGVQKLGGSASAAMIIYDEY